MSGIKIIKVGVTYSRSIRVADYKYYKPAVYMEAEVEEGVLPGQAMEALKAEARKEMQLLINEEKELYANELQKANLEKVMREHPHGSTEYILAKEKLEKYRAGELE